MVLASTERRSHPVAAGIPLSAWLKAWLWRKGDVEQGFQQETGGRRQSEC